MAQLAWNISYSVGVEALDGQHAGLFDVLNELDAALKKALAQSATGSLLARLANETREHFWLEEEMMASTRYPGLDWHRTRHGDLGMVLDELTAHHERSGKINPHLLHFFGAGLTRHIELEDKEYRPWMSLHGAR